MRPPRGPSEHEETKREEDLVEKISVAVIIRYNILTRGFVTKCRFILFLLVTIKSFHRVFYCSHGRVITHVGALLILRRQCATSTNAYPPTTAPKLMENRFMLL